MSNEIIECKINGIETEETKNKAERIEQFLNWYITSDDNYSKHIEELIRNVWVYGFNKKFSEFIKKE